MTVKKVDPSQDLQSDVITLLKNNKAGKSHKIAGEREEGEFIGVEESRVKIGLSKAINSELNPDQISAERRAKIEKLKELIASGQYNPPAEDVARALTEEIAFEIFTKPHDAVSFFDSDE